MKQKNKLVGVSLCVLIIMSFMGGCASGPKLGEPSDLQNELNKLPAIPISGKNVKFEFGGDIWISQVDGKNFLAGSFQSEDNPDGSGSTLTLTQTHVYSTEQKPGIGGDIGWVATPGPKIILEYKKGPPETLSAK
jgi:hypothetical protein